MTLHVDEFALEALERNADVRHGSTAAIVRTAVLYYLTERDSGRQAWRYPRFARQSPSGAGREIEIDEQTLQVLKAEAQRQGVDASELAAHACLFFLADLDSGRLAGKLEGILKES
jgi:nucleotide-binding universal stress UspA family protein